MSRNLVLAAVGLASAAVLGGAVALGGAALVGAFDGGETTTTVRELASAAQPAASTGDLSVREIYRRAGPGVVQITSTTAPTTTTDPFFGFQTEQPAQQALGSGFVIDRAGRIVTNYHVVEGAADIEVSFSNKDTYKATLVGSDPSTDLAVLEVDVSARALNPLSLADSAQVRVGDPVVAIGNPFGLERTVTSGIVSALQRRTVAPNGDAIDHVIQTDAPINQGNSGGPLLNARGEVIGVNSSISTPSGGNVGIGFAVPANTVKSVVAQLIRNGKVDRAFLGVEARPIEPELARLFRLPVDTGLLVETVTPGGAADKAGLRGGGTQVVVSGESYRLGGDVIVAAGGKRVTGIDELRAALNDRKPGDELELELYRDGERRTVTVKLGRQGPTSPRG